MTFDAVIGIDFGTSGYGVSFGYVDGSEVFILEKMCRDGRPVKKDQSAILFKKYDPYEVAAFGGDVWARYMEIPEHERGEWLLVGSPKMDLYNKANANGNGKMTAIGGKSVPIATVLFVTLREIRRNALKRIKDAAMLEDGDLKRDIRWVLTVPAIWSNEAKQMMRVAAERAGIPCSALVLTLEPEAAAISCQKQVIGSSNQILQYMAVGSTFMVVDAGKGTVDVTVHRVVSDALLEEAVSPSGGPWGSGMIDAGFEELCCDVFGKDGLFGFLREFANHWVVCRTRFEEQKCRHDLDQRDSVNIDMGPHFWWFFDNAGLLEDASQRSRLQTAERKWGGAIIVNTKAKMLQLSQAVMRRLFRPCIEGVRAHVRSILTTLVMKRISSVVVVGGLAGSPWLREDLSKMLMELPRHVSRPNLISPLDPEMAVVKGAVLFGRNSRIITKRVLPMTYGISTSTPWASSDRNNKFYFRTSEGLEYRTGKFLTFVKKGTVMPVDQVVEHIVFPVDPVQTSVSCSIHAVFEKNAPAYVDGLASVAEMVVSVPRNSTEMGIKVAMRFGGTEIEASTTTSTGEVTRVAIDFTCRRVVPHEQGVCVPF